MRKLKSKFTAEDLHHLPSTDQMMGLVRGKVYEIAPAGGRHGSVARRIASRLGNYADWKMTMPSSSIPRRARSNGMSSV